MPDYKKLARGLNTAIRAAEAEASALQKMKGTQDVLPAAEREANLAKMLSQSAVKSRLYHGTQAHDDYADEAGQAFQQFASRPTWLAKEPYTASGYSAGKGTTYPVHAQIKKPLILGFDANESAEKAFPSARHFGVDVEHIKSSINPERAWQVINHPSYIDAVEKAGHDAILINEGGYRTYGVFDPRKIKSAIGNRGTYDVSEPDITKAKGGPIHMQKGGKAGALGKLTEAFNAASKEADAIINASKLEEALKAKQAPMTTPQGTGLPLMPRSAGMYTPGVEQKDLARMPMVDKARAEGKTPKYTPRMQDLLDSPTARKKVNTLIEKGKDLGMTEWYGTEPLRQVAMDIGMSQKQFDEFLAQMASASQRNPVDQQNRMGSYLWHLSQSGKLPEDAYLLTNKIKRGKQAAPEGTAIELPPGYGSLAQGDIFSRGKQIAAGDIEGALPETAKLGTFFRNLQGNLKPVTVDVNAVRGPVIERGDPRWLTSKLVEKDEEGNILNTYFPRKDVESGKLSLKEAKARPGFWEAAPSGSEYAGFEDLWQRAAKRHGVAPAEAQALGWYGSADVTALKTKPELYIDNLERMIRRTAEQTGQNPRQVMEDVLRGKQYLKKKGGAVHKIKAFDSDEAARKWKDEIAAEINKANGGAIKKMGWKATPAMKMAQGGAPNLGPADDHTMPDSSDAGRMNYEPGYAHGGVAHFDEGGGTEKAKLMAEILARMAKDQGKQEIESLKKPRALTDLANRGIVASTVGAPVDIMNMGLEGIDFLRSKATGKPVENRLASDKPFLGSEHLKDLMTQYGMTTGEERPMMETGLSLVSPAGAVKGAAKTAEAAPKVGRAIEGGLNAATATMARPFTPATVTMEAVAPDLAKYKPRQWQETATRRMTGEGAPVSMETLGGQRTTKRPGQGVYENFEGQLETNPLVAVDVPRAGNLSTNKALRRDISQAGADLAQESVAAHRFLPMATNNIADASAMLIKPQGRSLTNEEVIKIGEQLPGMIVAHNPRLGGVVVMPYDYQKGKVPTEFFDAQDIAKSVLGKKANFTYGKADPVKDRLYIERGDYATEGAGTPSAASTAMRDRLKRAEARAFRAPAQSRSGLPAMRGVPATTAD